MTPAEQARRLALWCEAGVHAFSSIWSAAALHGAQMVIGRLRATYSLDANGFPSRREFTQDEVLGLASTVDLLVRRVLEDDEREANLARKYPHGATYVPPMPVNVADLSKWENRRCSRCSFPMDSLDEAEHALHCEGV